MGTGISLRKSQRKLKIGDSVDKGGCTYVVTGYTSTGPRLVPEAIAHGYAPSLDTHPHRPKNEDVNDMRPSLKTVCKGIDLYPSSPTLKRWVPTNPCLVDDLL